MADAKVQTFENHARIVPAYHRLTFGLIVVNLFYRIYVTAVAFSFDALMSLFVAVALVMLFFFARIFALRVQDRVIRLEMRLRLAQVLPVDLRGRINEFTVNQLCSLRFASDAELPDLARKVLDEKLDDRKTIKKMIRTWEADWLRA
jgi:hypothetical protein